VWSPAVPNCELADASVFLIDSTALLRQSDANWEAYFIVTDDQPFDEELQAILDTYSDVRLRYLPLDMRFRPKVRAARMRAQ
jgi:hypothetical protein